LVGSNYSTYLIHLSTPLFTKGKHHTVNSSGTLPFFERETQLANPPHPGNPRRGARAPNPYDLQPWWLYSSGSCFDHHDLLFRHYPSSNLDHNRRLILRVPSAARPSWPTKGLARIRPSTRAIKMLPALKYAPHGS
jgi:hypothetical protein